jgi:hypothetical protein
MRTLQQILIDANAYLDLEAEVPSGDELITRANYANQAVQDASAIGQFSEFHQIYEVFITAGASVPLPNNFRELVLAPKQRTGGGWVSFEQIHPQDRFNKEVDDKYCYVIGNPASGYTAVFNGLEASATISFDYQRYPSGLLTLTDVCELSDATYVTSKIEAYVLESRNNERFPLVKADANIKLQNMLGREQKTLGGGTNTTPRQGTAAYSIG